LIFVNQRYFRPTEVNVLVGDASKAYKDLGWKSKITFDQLVTLMVEHDCNLVKNNIGKN